MEVTQSLSFLSPATKLSISTIWYPPTPHQNVMVHIVVTYFLKIMIILVNYSDKGVAKNEFSQKLYWCEF